MFTPFAFIKNPSIAAIPATPSSSAQAFITAANITNTTQQTAIINLVTDLYTYSLWDKMTAIYPFVGGTATTHKYNLKDPRDSDDAYRITFGGGMTHNSNGIQGDGVSGYANTNAFTNTTAIPDRANHWSMYIRQLGYTSPGYNGVLDYPSTIAFFGFAGSVGNNIGLGLQTFQFYNNPAIAASNGFYNGTIRRSPTTSFLYLNGSSIIDGFNNYQFTNEFNFYLGAMWFNGAVNYYNDTAFAFASLGNNLTATDAANFYTAVQAFQTTLGRQV